MESCQRFKRLMKERETVQELILNERIRTFFQPIVDLDTVSIIGHEALSRGPEGTEFEDPSSLFDAAMETDLVSELDSLCRRKALENAKGIGKGLKLFLNCMPTAILDINFRDAALETLLNDLEIRPKDLVIEITEREAVEDYYLYKQAIAHYSSVGCSLAVDDTGAGYSSLMTVIELRPHYIKVDMSIVRGIEGNVMKQELVKGMIALAAKMDSKIIAEGIETEEELDALVGLGVGIGHGYLFARPAPAFPAISR